MLKNIWCHMTPLIIMVMVMLSYFKERWYTCKKCIQKHGLPAIASSLPQWLAWGASCNHSIPLDSSQRRVGSCFFGQRSQGRHWLGNSSQWHLRLSLHRQNVQFFAPSVFYSEFLEGFVFCSFSFLTLLSSSFSLSLFLVSDFQSDDCCISVSVSQSVSQTISFSLSLFLFLTLSPFLPLSKW